MTGTVQQPRRVLVVDDEPNIVSMALRFQGFAVESAGTGAAVLSAVEAFRPDLLVLDVMLPDMEGFEVARRLGDRRAEVPIVFPTARDAARHRRPGRRTDRAAGTTSRRHGRRFGPPS